MSHSFHKLSKEDRYQIYVTLFLSLYVIMIQPSLEDLNTITTTYIYHNIYNIYISPIRPITGNSPLLNLTTTPYEVTMIMIW